MGINRENFLKINYWIRWEGGGVQVNYSYFLERLEQHDKSRIHFYIDFTHK